MRRTDVILGLATVALLGGPVLAQTPVTGNLQVDGYTIAPTDGVAMWDESTAAWEEGKRVVRVYLFLGAISTEGIAEALAPHHEVRKRIEGDFVVLTLNAGGTLNNVYALIREGARNFGFMGAAAVAVEELGEGRASGRVYTETPQSIGDTPLEFDLTFDCPILPEREAGTTLPAGGGEPGAAYLAYIKALLEGDFETLIRHASSQRAAELEAIDGSLREWQLESLKELAPKQMHVTGGELFEGFAILTVEGTDWADDKVKGSVKMLPASTGWRFADEKLETVW